MIPVTTTAPNRIANSSGILREFTMDLFPITTISTQNGGLLEFSDEIQGEFASIFVFRDWISEFLEESGETGRGAAENRLAFGEEDQTVEKAEDSVAWLMDGHDYNAAALRDSLENFDHHECASGVEAGGRLVEEEDDRVVDDVDSDRDAAALPAGDAAVALVADHDITLSSFDSRISPFIFTVPPRLSRAILLASASIRIVERQNKRKRAGIRHGIIELENTMIIGVGAVVRSFTGGVSDAVQKLAESHGDAMPRPPRELLKLHSLARPQKRKITRRRHVISGRSLRHGNNVKHSNSTVHYCTAKLNCTNTDNNGDGEKLGDDRLGKAKYGLTFLGSVTLFLGRIAN
nr:Os03g0282166 [Ipomoea batatas]